MIRNNIEISCVLTSNFGVDRFTADHKSKKAGKFNMYLRAVNEKVCEILKEKVERKAEVVVKGKIIPMKIGGKMLIGVEAHEVDERVVTGGRNSLRMTISIEDMRPRDNKEKTFFGVHYRIEAKDFPVLVWAKEVLPQRYLLCDGYFRATVNRLARQRVERTYIWVEEFTSVEYESTPLMKNVMKVLHFSVFCPYVSIREAIEDGKGEIKYGDRLEKLKVLDEMHRELEVRCGCE